MSALLNLLPRPKNALVHLMPHLRECCLPLCVPLLQLLVTRLKYLCPGSAQLTFIDRGLCLSRRDSAPSLLYRTRGACTPLCQHAVQWTAHQQTISCYQQNKQNHRRHRAEHKFTELIQYLIHEWGRPKPLGSPVVSYLTQLDCSTKTGGIGAE